MPSYHCRIKRGLKGSAENHANYIMRQGAHRHRDDVLFNGYGNLPTWAENQPALFWAKSDKYERENGTAYKELVIALPAEFSTEQQMLLVERIIGNLIGPKPFQYAVHSSASSLQGELNVHVHVMYSDRLPDGIERPPEQMFLRYNPVEPSRGGQRKDSGGRTSVQIRDELIDKRRLVADIQNEHLALNGYSARVDHRSLKEQGIARVAERHLGQSGIRKMSDEEKNDFIELRAARQHNADELNITDAKPLYHRSIT